MMTPTGRRAILPAMIVRDAREWARYHARGRHNFILRYGIFARGIPMALVVAIGIELYLGNSFPAAFRDPSFLGRLLLSLVVFSISGSFRAIMLWNLYERRFGGSAGA